MKTQKEVKMLKELKDTRQKLEALDMWCETHTYSLYNVAQGIVTLLKWAENTEQEKANERERLRQFKENMWLSPWTQEATNDCDSGGSQERLP